MVKLFVRAASIASFALGCGSESSVDCPAIASPAVRVTLTPVLECASVSVVLRNDGFEERLSGSPNLTGCTFVGGYERTGKFTIDVSAPGFRSVRKEAEVTRETSGCRTVKTVALNIELVR